MVALLLAVLGYGKHFHGNCQSETLLLHFRIVGSVVLLHDIVNKTCFSLNAGQYIFLPEHTPSFIARGKSPMDGYDIMAYNQNLDSEYEWDLHFWNVTVELYYGPSFSGVTS